MSSFCYISSFCSKISCPDLSVSVTMPYIAKPLADCFDAAIVKSRFRAIPAFVGMVLTGITAIALESLVRLAVAIITFPLLIGAFSCFDERVKSWASIPVKALAAAEVHLWAGLQVIVIACESIFNAEEMKFDESAEVIGVLKDDSIILNSKFAKALDIAEEIDFSGPDLNLQVPENTELK